ncbi:unnamed protein product [Didymodactylos carnosus]|uniref:Ion transport domain-containing protein n=1 Tax=Didymodactylos carnosus TaxID=1234261 RepID=A0A8S2I0M0_9BILA|nr:unnamed protein product [Didymodactylos carnosus]CAF3700237.1 unnamed protein product [Didymodactylos carnosus]
MGNTGSEVASGVKAQIQTGGQAPELYRFVNLKVMYLIKGGGELVDVMRIANRTKNYTEIDALIRDDVSKFLYNGGNGKRELTKRVCWDLDKRGGVGETILHVCFLNSTTVHSALAKRLIRHFPNLINDIYIDDEYYGENVLHIAIVNEEPATVKFLLDNGVDFTQRCCGVFFCPADQKSSRVDNFTKECPDVSIPTNYEGYCYFGEYPLSFAAVLQQEESVRLLVAKGADPNCQDSNGNTVLHMCVIHNKKAMFDLLYELGGHLDIKNRQGLTPLTLAAVLAQKDLFDHILQKSRDIYWQYGNVTCAGYPLEDIDTIGKDGSMNDTSALNIIVRGESAGHLDMMDGLIVQLLVEKWRTFIKFKFFQRMAIFALYFAIGAIAMLIRGIYRIPSTCIVHQLIDKQDNDVKALIALTIFDSLSIIGAVTYLIFTVRELSYQHFKLDSFIYVNDPTRVLFLFSCLLTISLIPARLTCSYSADDILCVFAMLTRAPYFFFFCRGFRSTGPFVVMIYTMIRGDLLRFFLIFVVFMTGFSQALHVLFVRIHCENDFETNIGTFFRMFCVTLQQVSDAYKNFAKHPNHGIQIIAKVLFVTYIITAAVLLVNMLIAMMGNTYAMVNERKKEWLRQWAKIMLVVEQGVSRDERLLQQSNYSKKMANGVNVLIVRLGQTEEEREAIENMHTACYEQIRKQFEPEKPKTKQNTWVLKEQQQSLLFNHNKIEQLREKTVGLSTLAEI